MLIQLIAMDLDGTLADLNCPIQPETVKILQELQKEEIKLVLTSGKPISYLSGLIRQLGMEDIILIGDNGAVIYFNHTFPPRKPIVLEMTSAAKEEIEKLRTKLLKEFGEKIWIQPNQVTLSLFGMDFDITKVYDYIDRIFKEEKIRHLKNFKTKGALDILPNNIDKGVALKLVQDELKIPIEDTAVIGDGTNDVPMFLRAKIRITFAKTADIFTQFVPKIVKNIDAALRFLIEISKFEKNMMMESLSGNGVGM